MAFSRFAWPVWSSEVGGLTKWMEPSSFWFEGHGPLHQAWKLSFCVVDLGFQNDSLWGKVLSRVFWPWQCMEWFWRASTPSFSTILGVWLEQPGSCFTCGFWMVGAGFLPCRRNSDWRNLEIEVYGSPAFLCRLGLPSPETSSRHIFSNIFFCVPKGFHSNFHLVFRKVS